MSAGPIRPVAPEDLVALAGLLDEYLVETFHKKWTGTIDGLRAALVTQKEASCLIALDDGEVVGFSIWRRTWDPRQCLAGAELLDIYVRPEVRGGVLAPLLLHETVAVVARDGHFLMGRGASVQANRLSDRLAVTFPGTEFIVGGRAFRELAALHGRPLREIIRALPPREANFEP